MVKKVTGAAGEYFFVHTTSAGLPDVQIFYTTSASLSDVHFFILPPRASPAHRFRNKLCWVHGSTNAYWRRRRNQIFSYSPREPPGRSIFYTTSASLPDVQLFYTTSASLPGTSLQEETMRATSPRVHLPTDSGARPQMPTVVRSNMEDPYSHAV